jgi:hypothetical protein
MRLLRGIAGALLWIVSLVLILVGGLLCVTLILLPIGIPLLGYARRMFATSMKLMLPRAVTHPAETSQKAMRSHGRNAKKQAARDFADTKDDIAATRKRGRKKVKQVRKKAKRTHKKLPLVS